MNILYIGTYRTDDDSGEISRLYLEDLSKNHNVTARPVFISNKNISKLDSSLENLETNLLSDYDCCIQALPLDMLTFSGLIKNHIALVSSNNLTSINDYAIINQLKWLNTAIVNTNEDEAILVRSGVSCDIKKIDCPLNFSLAQSINKKFNFGIHNDNHKFYLFADYKEDMEIVHKIILAFYMAFRCREGYSLIMVLSGSEQDKEHLYQSKRDLKKQLSIVDHPNSINELYIFDQLSDEDKVVMHNSCDTFLDLSPTANALQKQYALFFGNNIIDKTNTNTIEIPYRSTYSDSMYYPGNYIESSTTNGIATTMIACGKSITKNPTTNIYNKKLSNAIS